MIIQERRARSTKTVVQVVDNREFEIDDDPSVPWYTICVDHGGCVGHPTRRLALHWAPAPEEWCPTCQENKHGPDYHSKPY